MKRDRIKAKQERKNVKLMKKVNIIKKSHQILSKWLQILPITYKMSITPIIKPKSNTVKATYHIFSLHSQNC